MKGKISFLSGFFTLFSTALLCMLGVWQLQRLHWKEAILTALAEDVVDPSAARVNFSELVSKGDFTSATVYGHYLEVADIALGPRTHNGIVGYHILAPFALEGGGVVLVNRGWVPIEKKALRTRPESRIAGPSWVYGRIRRPERANPFVPANRPAQDAWYQIDTESMAEARGIPVLAPVVLYAQRTPERLVYPAMDAIHTLPPNNHLSYALFWFSMAGILIVIFGLRFLSDRETPGPGHPPS